MNGIADRAEGLAAGRNDQAASGKSLPRDKHVRAVGAKQDRGRRGQVSQKLLVTTVTSAVVVMMPLPVVHAIVDLHGLVRMHPIDRDRDDPDIRRVLVFCDRRRPVPVLLEDV